ncbi:MAG TPA: threonine synthase [candidate division Zixibacteria bacterium]
MNSHPRFALRCGLCGRSHDPAVVQRLCADCQRPLVVEYELSRALGHAIRSGLSARPHSLWRYADVLPIRNPENAVTLGEGATPLVRSERLCRRLGIDELWIKDESQNPTGSFKARGMSVAITRAVELGVRRFCLPSAGNAGGAAAAYAAKAGCEVRVFLPADSGEAFFAECRAHGAQVVAVDGTIADCAAQMRLECNPNEWFDLSTLKEPFRLEGKKTMGYELWDDLGGQLPDVIVYPTGGGTGLIGMWRAFGEMQQLGWIGDERPRMVSVQAVGCAPIVNAFESGSEFASPVSNPSTSALGLRVPSAIGDFLILRAIRQSRGWAVAVTEEQWAEGQSWLASDAGLFASPEGGAAVAGLYQAVARAKVSSTDRVVVFNTGSGFKYPPSVHPRAPSSRT